MAGEVIDWTVGGLVATQVVVILVSCAWDK